MPVPRGMENGYNELAEPCGGNIGQQLVWSGLRMGVRAGGQKGDEV